MHNQATDLPHIQLATMSRWYVVSRAIHTVAKIGLANHMSLTPISITVLAKNTHTRPELLDRLLQFLTSYGLFNFYAPDSYALTNLSMPLRDDDPHSIKDVLCMVDEYWWQAFSSLDKSLQEDIPAFSRQHGDDFFSFLSKNPDKQENFDRGMAKLSTFDDEAIANAYDFSTCRSVVDLGGGRGGLARAISKHFPQVAITLFDTEAVIAQLKADDFPPNISLHAGNFLAQIPVADAYLFKGVLHDFSDSLMSQILRNCHKQMSASAKLLIAEQILPEGSQPHPNKTMDIVMLVLLGGRQRSLQEWQKIVDPLGFQYQAHYPTTTIFTVMEFRKKN